MKITGIRDKPLGRVSYLNVDGKRQLVRESLSILLGTVSGLPTGISGLVAMADLQGRERGKAGPGRLLGEVVAEHLAELSDAGKIPRLDRLGVLLAGDFFAVPELKRRGGIGDVSEVWQALRDRFRWVAGVLGNHDDLDPHSLVSEAPQTNSHLLDGGFVELDGLRIGGVSGIIGDPAKVNRKTEQNFLRVLEDVLVQQPVIVITHEGPACPPFAGSRTLRETFETWEKTCVESGTASPLLVCGHKHWPAPLAELPHGMQVLNVDSRVVLLLGA